MLLAAQLSHRRCAGSKDITNRSMHRFDSNSMDDFHPQLAFDPFSFVRWFPAHRVSKIAPPLLAPDEDKTKDKPREKILSIASKAALNNRRRSQAVVSPHMWSSIYFVAPEDEARPRTSPESKTVPSAASGAAVDTQRISETMLESSQAYLESDLWSRDGLILASYGRDNNCCAALIEGVSLPFSCSPRFALWSPPAAFC